MGAAGVCLALGLVLGSALLEWRFAPFTLRLNGSLGLSTPRQAAFLDTGEILFTPVYGNDCRKVLFSNRTGRFGPDLHVRCDAGLAAARALAALRDAGPSERMKSIHQAFTSRAVQ